MIPGHDRGRSRQPRLGVVDIYDLDRQRQLVLLRRDNVEHLLLIGGLNDVVIETNIVRVAGARIPSPEAGAPERFEPSFDQAPRPQVEPSGRPSIETQLAAQLGAFIRRPSEESDVDQELSPVASVTAPAPARPEPVLKPDQVTVTASAAVEPLRPQTPPPASFLRAPATPEPPAPPVRSEPPLVRPEPRPVTPPPFQSRPTPVPPPVTPAPVPAPEVVLPPQAVPVEAKTPDAAILSDMAKQLEEALKRPAQPVAPPQPVLVEEPIGGPMDEVSETGDELDEDELLVPAARDERQEPPAPEPEHREPPRPAPEPQRPAAAQPQPPAPPASPVPAPTASPASAAPAQPQSAPASAPKVTDPFSVEEIEAEFARLLGRSRDPGNKG